MHLAGSLYSFRPIQPYNFQADLIWCDGAFKLGLLNERQRRFFIVLLAKRHVRMINPYIQCVRIRDIFGTDPDPRISTFD